MSLFENGKDFIERSIYSYDEAKDRPKEYKYALLLLGIGAELILKRILEIEHPLFVLEKFENESKTVPFGKLIDRIKVVHKEKGKRIKKEDIQNIKAIRSIRNNIIHKEVNITEEPSIIFSKTLFTLDRMVKLFLGTTLSKTISNWEHVVSDDTVRSHYYKGIKGIDIAGVLVPCPFCSLEVLVPEDSKIKCHHCENTYHNMVNILFLLDDDNELKNLLIDSYVKEILQKSSLGEKIKTIHQILDFRMKNRAINELIDSIQEINDVTFDCPQCNQFDYLIYDNELDHLICINCYIFESNKCHKCQRNSMVTNLDGADFCLVCRSNTQGVSCDNCHTKIFSYLNPVKIDVINYKKFDLSLDYSGEPFIYANVCETCKETLEFYDADEVIRLM